MPAAGKLLGGHAQVVKPHTITEWPNVGFHVAGATNEAGLQYAEFVIINLGSGAALKITLGKSEARQLGRQLQAAGGIPQVPTDTVGG